MRLWRLKITILSALVVAAMFGHGGAGAAPVICDAAGPTAFLVATADEFDDAVACFNAGTAGPGTYSITFAGPLVSSNEDFVGEAVFATIEQSTAGYALAVDAQGFGAGHDLDFTPGAVFGISPVNVAPVVFANLNVTAVDVHLAVIWNESSASLVVQHSSFDDNQEAAAVWSSGDGLTVVQNTFVRQHRVGVRSAGPLDIYGSTFDENEPDVLAGAGDITIVNSTLNSPIGFDGLEAGTGTIRNSTIAAFMLVDDNSSAAVTLTSNILGSCMPDGVFIDGGGNVGGCFSPNDPNPALSPLADNGCAIATPRGCVPTRALPVGSIAIGAGDCTNEFSDQRGEPRTPADVGCDAGSFEDPVGPPLYCNGLQVTINMANNGGDGRGTAGDDVILGTTGDDVIRGMGGNDTVCAAAGNDRIVLEGGNDVILAGPGDDNIWSGIGDDLESPGADVIDGGPGIDRIRGGAGDDTIDGGDGRDIINGGAGDDLILGGAGRDTIAGAPGDDTIDGGLDTDVVNGGDGDDNLVGGITGNDRLVGGVGNDRLNTSASTGSNRLIGGAGNDTLIGSAQLDRFWGDAGNDVIRGGGFSDLVRAGDGNDDVDGQDGRDTIDGGAGDDNLRGGPGNADRLVGGAGIDRCDGGSGNNDVANATCETILGVP